jgi:hypothetical protein
MWSVLALVGCLEPPPPPEPEKPPCTLSFDALPGKTFVRHVSKPEGGYEEDVLARARFYKEGETLKVKYNTRALVDMYDYTCGKGKGEILCKADNPSLKQWCQTLIANKGSCSPAELADLTGVSVADATKAYEELTAELKGQTPEQLEKMKVAFSSPSNQLRGVLHVKMNLEECHITVRDTYETMTQGQVRELENFVGSSRFVESNRDMVFDHCKDQLNLVALATPEAAPRPGETKVPWKPGESVPFRFAGEAGAKAEPGCTYTMDQYVVYEPKAKAVAVEPGADGKLPWGFDHTFNDAGSKVVHLYRHKTCGGKTELIDMSCAMVKIAP